MKPILLEIRDRLETLCDSIELNTTNREDTLSSVRYLLSIVADTCDRTKDPMDATTVSRNFITGLPNNNAFIKAADEIFFGKYLVSESGNNQEMSLLDGSAVIGDGNGTVTENNDKDIMAECSYLEWGLLLIDADDFTKLVESLSVKCKDPELGPNLLRNMSQSIYSCITSEHQVCDI